MPALPFMVLRLILAALSVLFANQLGKVGTRLRVRGQPLFRAATWFLRTFVTAFAVFWVGGFDTLTILTLLAVAVSFGAGVWTEIRPRRDDSVHLNLGQ